MHLYITTHQNPFTARAPLGPRWVSLQRIICGGVAAIPLPNNPISAPRVSIPPLCSGGVDNLE